VKAKIIMFIIAAGLAISAAAALAVLGGSGRGPTPPAVPAHRSHLDHGPFFEKDFTDGPSVTRACQECHPKAAAQMLESPHFTWLSRPAALPGRPGTHAVGKRNLLNNYCIGIAGNETMCTKCHAGYGWGDGYYDFTREENVDCLVCHDWSGGYAKAGLGLPEPGVDLRASARSVGYPRRDNCGVCHFFGGGGMGVKHGDLNASLSTPKGLDDVHMGGHGMLCIDCHGGRDHVILGRSIAVSIDRDHGLDCRRCHQGAIHQDERISRHERALACQTCHIPTHARNAPTKMDWDWSQAGDAARPEDDHLYLKKKGAFIYGQSLTPEYYWWNGSIDRYLNGDVIDPDATTYFNPPRGDIHDPAAKIHPFKVHRGKQPYDQEHRHLLPVKTVGETGYWTTFDWESALRQGAKEAGMNFSGRYGFAATAMYWPLNHTVRPASEALSCTDCHGEHGRMDWNALGYDDDPAKIGGRP